MGAEGAPHASEMGVSDWGCGALDAPQPLEGPPFGSIISSLWQLNKYLIKIYVRLKPKVVLCDSWQGDRQAECRVARGRPPLSADPI